MKAAFCIIKIDPALDTSTSMGNEKMGLQNPSMFMLQLLDNRQHTPDRFVERGRIDQTIVCLFVDVVSYLSICKAFPSFPVKSTLKSKGDIPRHLPLLPQPFFQRYHFLLPNQHLPKPSSPNVKITRAGKQGACHFLDFKNVHNPYINKSKTLLSHKWSSEAHKRFTDMDKRQMTMNGPSRRICIFSKLNYSSLLKFGLISTHDMMHMALTIIARRLSSSFLIWTAFRR